MPSSFGSSLSEVLQNGYWDFVFGEYRNHRAIELISSQQFRNFSLHLTDSSDRCEVLNWEARIILMQCAHA